MSDPITLKKQINYLISEDTAKGSVFIPTLNSEIDKDYRIHKKLLNIANIRGVLQILFSDSLSDPEVAALDSIVANHQGVTSLDELFRSLIDVDIEDYALALYYEGRIKLDTAKLPTFRQPAGYDRAVATIKKFGDDFAKSAKTTSKDQADVLRKFKDIKDPIRRLGFWSEYRRLADV